MPDGAGLTDFDDSDFVSEASSLTLPLSVLFKADLTGDSLGALGGLSFTGVFACNNLKETCYVCSNVKVFNLSRGDYYNHANANDHIFSSLSF